MLNKAGCYPKRMAGLTQLHTAALVFVQTGNICTSTTAPLLDLSRLCHPTSLQAHFWMPLDGATSTDKQHQTDQQRHLQPALLPAYL